MGSLSLAEILVIVVVILVVFGPRRLPELSRRAGAALSKLREGTSYVTQAIDSEYGEAMEPIRELKKEFDGIKGDVTRAVSGIGDLEDQSSKQDPTTPPVEGTDAGEELPGSAAR